MPHVDRPVANKGMAVQDLTPIFRRPMTARPDHERETVTIPRSEYEALRAAASATGFLWY